MFRFGIKAKLLLSILIFNILLGLGTFWYVGRLAGEQAEQAALEAARQRANLVAQLRAYYAEKVVPPALKKNLDVTYNYPAAVRFPPIPGPWSCLRPGHSLTE
jgi:hypothetical protein